MPGEATAIDVSEWMNDRSSDGVTYPMKSLDIVMRDVSENANCCCCL